jgi:hypothetical protein
MPVPKRKTSKSRRDMRQSCKFIRTQVFKSKLARAAQRQTVREAEAQKAQQAQAQTDEAR